TYDMQVRAIFEAATQLAREGVKVIPEVRVPLVGTVRELEEMKASHGKVAAEVMSAPGVRVQSRFGTQIAVRRGGPGAGKSAQEAEFFSFGTNDLTQLTFGYSRDDAGHFLPAYLDKGILEKDPFQSLDQDGVGQLVQIGVERGRKTRPNLKVGICGEHGGDPASVKFCHRVGMDYVSCSPFRVPIARLAAAQANIESPREA